VIFLQDDVQSVAEFVGFDRELGDLGFSRVDERRLGGGRRRDAGADQNPSVTRTNDASRHPFHGCDPSLSKAPASASDERER
jgi:hypothetical protein